ncbi:hypothetical protein, partial [Staphylococcus aureus]
KNENDKKEEEKVLVQTTKKRLGRKRGREQRQRTVKEVKKQGDERRLSHCGTDVIENKTRTAKTGGVG